MGILKSLARYPLLLILANFKIHLDETVKSVHLENMKKLKEF